MSLNLETNPYTVISYDFQKFTHDKFCPVYKNATTKLTLFCDKGSIIFNVYGDCCSIGWMEFDDLDHLIGLMITNITTKNCDIDLPESNIQEYDKNTLVTIHLTDSEFEFVHRNSSNGYYSNMFDISL
ncbi:hypothetical protein Hokovirus_1_13 [Hokovirus HKV1]|uniref:DUF7448 domain-containing protein n=1 Tax=Hokovirus HKV1 TaxID=1977638 RepID=A0A1V0SES7_9VIRU|nr:hypothetical protein Hokovirus_1_13 [Hokovirus HKV1]